MGIIHKNEIRTGYPVPSGKILLVGEQGDQLRIWTEYNGEPETKRFVILPTGGSTRESLEHLGTVQVGVMVWHVFAEPL